MLKCLNASIFNFFNVAHFSPGLFYLIAKYTLYIDSKGVDICFSLFFSREYDPGLPAYALYCWDQPSVQGLPYSQL